MKRSNRLVLLIGIFLAIVAFVILVTIGRRDGNGPIRTPRRGTDDTRRGHEGHHRSAPRSRRPGHDQADLATRLRPPYGSSSPAWSSARSPARPVTSRPARDRPTVPPRERHDRRHRRPRRASSPWPSRWTRSPASARSSRPATTWTWSSASPATSSRRHPLNPIGTRRRLTAAVAPGARTADHVKAAAPGHPGPRARCSRRPPSNAQRAGAARPPAPQRPSTASSRS